MGITTYSHTKPKNPNGSAKHAVLKVGDLITVDSGKKQVTFRVYSTSEDGTYSDTTVSYTPGSPNRFDNGTISGDFSLSGTNDISGSITRKHSGTHPFSHGTHHSPPVDVDDTGTFSGTHSY